MRHSQSSFELSDAVEPGLQMGRLTRIDASAGDTAIDASLQSRLHRVNAATGSSEAELILRIGRHGSSQSHQCKKRYCSYPFHTLLLRHPTICASRTYIDRRLPLDRVPASHTQEIRYVNPCYPSPVVQIKSFSIEEAVYKQRAQLSQMSKQEPETFAPHGFTALVHNANAAQPLHDATNIPDVPALKLPPALVTFAALTRLRALA